MRLWTVDSDQWRAPLNQYWVFSFHKRQRIFWLPRRLYLHSKGSYLLLHLSVPHEMWRFHFYVGSGLSLNKCYSSGIPFHLLSRWIFIVYAVRTKHLVSQRINRKDISFSCALRSIFDIWHVFNVLLCYTDIFPRIKPILEYFVIFARAWRIPNVIQPKFLMKIDR